jgi:hypothetical protein
VSLLPTLLWPLEGHAEIVARRLASLLSARELVVGPVYVLPPPVEPEAELRARLLALREERVDQHACDEIRIVYFATARHEAAPAGLQVIAQVATLLPALVPGAAHLELVTLVPLVESPDADKAAAVRFLREVERMAGQTRNLEDVLVFEDGVPELEAAIDEDGFAAGLGELLCRSLFASGVSEAIRGAGRAAVAHQRSSEAGKCCLTTVGGHTLVFEAEVTQQRLAARLTRSVVRQTLVPAEVDPAHLGQLAEQADAVIDGLARAYAAALPPAPAPLPTPETRSEAGPPAVLSAWRLRVEGQLRLMLDRLALAAPDPEAELDRAVQAALAHPVHVKAAEVLLGLLAGKPVVVDETQPERVFGVRRFHESFVLGPWRAALVAWVKTALARSGVADLPVRLDDETLPAWLGRAFAAAASVGDPADMRGTLTLKLLRDTALAAAVEPAVAGEASEPADPIAAVTEPYLVVAERALAAWREALAEREHAEGELLAVEQEFSGLTSWLFRRQEQKARQAEVRQRIDQAQAEAGRWQELLAGIHQTLGDFAARVVLPLRIRLHCAAELAGPIAARLGAVQSFIADLSGSADACAKDAEDQASASRGILQVLGETSILDCLYGRGVEPRTPEALLQQAMAMPKVPAARATWARFDSLPAHLAAGRAGAEALTGRLFDFGLQVFADVRELGVLDALATRGPGHTETVLEDTVKRALAFFPFAPGKIARLALHGIWQPGFVVRCRQGERSPAASTLTALASGSCQFIAIDPATELDVTCIVAGFPAGLIPWCPAG